MLNLNNLISDKLYLIVVNWWPWLNFFNDIFLLQYFVLCTYIYIYFYKNVYYTLLYTFLNFFLVGVYLCVFQVELFTAFLWLVECSVLFVFLLLLFFLNIKGSYTYTYDNVYVYVLLIFILFGVTIINHYSSLDNNSYIDIDFFGILDNFYESLFNLVCNDLFGFSISYYHINSIEFIIVGFLLLVGSVICVNLYQINKSVKTQNYNNFLSLFNFFIDFTNFSFLRKQNLIKQGNAKASLKIFKK